MKQNFTKIIFLLIAAGMTYGLQAQRFVDVTISSTNLNGTTEAVPANFGGLTLENYFDLMPITADLGLGEPNDGCTALTNDLTGQIALIDRGACPFVDKCLNAQNAGALAVIICNNNAGEGPVGMNGDDMGAITIPCISLSKEDCDLIKMEIPGASATISTRVPEVPADQLCYWGGNPGEGDFTGGFNDWTTVGLSADTAVWAWSSAGAGMGTLIGNSLTFSILSPTGGTGSAIFDSDLMNSELVDANAPPPYPMNSGELISPIIDCSECGSAKLQFYQYNVPLNGTTAVAFSFDGGETYTDPIEITTENVFTADETNIAGTEKEEINIPGIEGVSNFRVKFIFDGDFYFWIVDDVKIVGREANNIRVNDNFYAGAPNFRTPASQVEPINFLADVENIGSAAQTNVSLKIEITDESGASVFEDTENLGTVGADSLAENNLFDQQFTPAMEPSVYTGTYTVAIDNVDFDPSDNIQTFNFEITENEFAKEDGQNLAGVTPSDPSTTTWSFGNYFYVPNGSKFKVSRFGIGIGNASEIGGLDVGVRMFKWTNPNEDTDGDGFPEVDPSERELIGFADYEVLGNELPSDISLVEPVDEILLEDDAHYLVMMTMDATVAVSASDAFFANYAAMNLASTVAGTPRYWSFFGDSDDIGETVYTGFNSFTPIVRMYIESSVAAPELPAENLIALTPNPASEIVVLDMDFVNAFEKVTVLVTDVAGREVMRKQFENIQKEKTELTVSGLTNGTYMVNINTPIGIRTMKFIKVD